MTQAQWKKFFNTIRIRTDIEPVTPVQQADIDEFENAFDVKLPSSYRSFCLVYGAGELGKLFNIAVPGSKGKSSIFDLKRLQKLSHEGSDYEEYSHDAAQHARSLLFAIDIQTSKYFFDPDDITDSRRHEYGIYVLYRDWEVKRVADNFWQFITEICLGERLHELFDDDELPERIFQPISS